MYAQSSIDSLVSRLVKEQIEKLDWGEIRIDNSISYDDLLSDDIKAHKVMAVEAEKRQRIINASMQEFMKGYRQASTDVIVKNAGISKGLLFHYFSTKKGLFLFLLKYALDIIGGEYEKENYEGQDFLDNLWQLSLLARKLIIKHYQVYNFLVAGFFSLKEEFPEQLYNFRNPVEELKMNLLNNADRSLFRDDIDAEKGLHIILWTVNGYTENIAKLGRTLEDYIPHYEKIEKDLGEYLGVLRKTLYK